MVVISEGRGRERRRDWNDLWWRRIKRYALRRRFVRREGVMVSVGGGVDTSIVCH